MRRKDAVINLSPFDFLSLVLIEVRSKRLVLSLQRFRKATHATPAVKIGAPVLLTAEQAQGLSREISSLARFMPRTEDR